MPSTVNFPGVRNNADFAVAFVYKDQDDNPIDLTGKTLRMQIRRPASGVQVWANLTSETDGGIEVTDAAGGAFQLVIPMATLLKMPPGTYEHDLVAVAGSSRDMIWKGELVVEQGVTRD